jgi:hypothetical protein
VKRCLSPLAVAGLVDFWGFGFVGFFLATAFLAAFLAGLAIGIPLACPIRVTNLHTDYSGKYSETEILYNTLNLLS